MSDEQTTSELLERLQKMADKPGMNAVNHTGRATLHLAADRLEALQARVVALEGDNESLANDLHETMVAKDNLFDEALVYKRRVDALEAATLALVEAWDEDEIGQIDGGLIEPFRKETP